MKRPGVLVAFAMSMVAATAEAHTTSTGLARITIDGTDIVYKLTLIASELPETVRRPFVAAADGDAAAAEQVAEELRQRVAIDDVGKPCRPGRAVIQGSRLGDAGLTLELTLRCPAPPSRLAITDEWSSLLGEHHQTLARIERGDTVHEVTFSAQSRQAVVELAAAPRRGGFLLLGVSHVLSGYDHMLFLVALLLRGGRLLSLLKIITAFTVAHSVTLALAVLRVMTVPERLVESVIAASIVWVAIENLVSTTPPKRRWLVAFGFGLVHGLGFASALAPLGLHRTELAAALLLFNLGVECGQAVVVVALLPILLWVYRRHWEPFVVRAGSAVLGMLALVWFVERLLA